MNSTNNHAVTTNGEVENLAKQIHNIDEVTQKRLLAIENLLIDISFMLSKILLNQQNKPDIEVKS